MYVYMIWKSCFLFADYLILTDKLALCAWLSSIYTKTWFYSSVYRQMQEYDL